MVTSSAPCVSFADARELHKFGPGRRGVSSDCLDGAEPGRLGPQIKQANPCAKASNWGRYWFRCKLGAQGECVMAPRVWMLNFIARMKEKIENLVKLQALELERARLAQAVRALPAEMAQADAALK